MFITMHNLFIFVGLIMSTKFYLKDWKELNDIKEQTIVNTVKQHFLFA